MRTVKILAGVAGGILVLLAAALLAVWLSVNPNDYKGQIAAAVRQATGRDLRLTGDIRLAVFPWVALQLGPASLGNPPGFGDEPFVAFKHASVRVRLFPLLAKRLEMDRVDLDGPDLRLVKDSRGVGNWQVGGPSPGPAAKTGGAPMGGPLAELAGIRITNGRVSYQGMVAEKLNLEMGAFDGHAVTPVSIAFQASRGVPDENLSLNAKFDLSADAQFKWLRLEAVSFSGLLARPGDEPPVHWEVSAPTVEVDLSGQTLAVPAFAMSYSSAHVTGKLLATKILEDLSATGSVTLAPLVLHEFAPRIGVALPRTSDPRALAQLSASSEFSYDAGGVRLDPIQAQLDDTQLKGSVAWAGEPRALKFALTVDQINLDRYLSADPDPGAGDGAAAKAEGGGGQAGGGAVSAGGASASLEADGVLSVGALHLSPLDFANVRVTLGLKDKVAHLYPSLAQIDGGHYSGNITVDDRGAAPALSIDEHLSGVDMARLLAGTSYRGRMSGRGTVNLKATARGAALDGILRTLNGHFDANLSNGALEGVDLGYELARAQALIKREAAPVPSNPPRTPFDAVKISAEISNGVARTSDLTIASPVLRVTGRGSANLNTQGIDFQMLASVLKAPGASLADIPLRITGTYVDPKVRPDVQALVKGQIKEKLQDLLEKNGLKGLFNR